MKRCEASVRISGYPLRETKGEQVTEMAEARTRIGRRAAIVGSLVLAALLYAAPVAAADSADTTSTDASTPTVISQQGVEWTDVVRNPTLTLRAETGRTVLGNEWTLTMVQPLGVEWTD
jgi:hypothetical protein